MPKADAALFVSPPIARAVAVLNFLAGHAEQAFTLTEIAKSLRISSATCHNLLATLTASGYVYRTVGKTYVLGPALARVAQASLAPALVMQVARPEMRALADMFDVVCSAYQLEGREVIVRERASAVSHINWNTPYLPTIPATAPIGGMFLAWRGHEEQQSWIDAAMPPLQEDERARLLKSMELLRGRGFDFGVRKVTLDPDRARALQNKQALTEYSLSQIERARAYQLAYVAAPVFSRPGVVAFGLSLAGFVEAVKGDAVERMGERLREACDRIGAFIAGRDPILAGPGSAAWGGGL